MSYGASSAAHLTASQTCGGPRAPAANTSSCDYLIRQPPLKSVSLCTLLLTLEPGDIRKQSLFLPLLLLLLLLLLQQAPAAEVRSLATCSVEEGAQLAS